MSNVCIAMYMFAIGYNKLMRKYINLTGLIRSMTVLSGSQLATPLYLVQVQWQSKNFFQVEMTQNFMLETNLEQTV